MKENLLIGVVAKPQGIRGELKVIPYTDDVNRFNGLKNVLIDGKNFSVRSSKAVCGGAIVWLDGINDRNSAELFRGKELFVKREDAIKPAEGRYFIEDLIGCKLLCGENVVGEITDVTAANTDYFTVSTDKGVMRFPFLKDVVLRVDVENGAVFVDKKRLNEVACYEN